MTKVEHVSRLIHRRDDLVHRRDELARESAQVDQSIAAIDAEIERAWQSAATQPILVPLSSLLANGQKPTPTPTPENYPHNNEEDEDDEADQSTEESESHADRVFAMLRRSNDLDYGQAAVEIYNEDTPQTRKRVRATLSYLKRTGRIRNLSRNRWEVLSAS